MSMKKVDEKNAAALYAAAVGDRETAALGPMRIAFALFASQRCDSADSFAANADLLAPVTARAANTKKVQETENADALRYLRAAQYVSVEVATTALTALATSHGRRLDIGSVNKYCARAVKVKGVPSAADMRDMFGKKPDVTEWTPKMKESAAKSLRAKLDDMVKFGAITKTKYAAIVAALV